MARVAGRILGDRFALEDRIGGGGFADVYRAADKEQSGMPVAVKILRIGTAVSPEAEHRFKRELRLMVNLQHINVIGVLGHGESPGLGTWYAMPLARGSLAESLNELTGQTPRILDVMVQVCAGLIYIHGQGILHRDLKPGNILRTAAGMWAISDFGLAVEAERQTTRLTPTSREGLGTPWYAAPEQVVNPRHVDLRSDIYSAGKVLQELVTGETPVSTDMPPGNLRPVVARATADRPDDRYQSVDEFLDAVKRAIETPNGRWETAQETAERLLERVRLPQPDAGDLETLVTWSQSLDEHNPDDMNALTHVLPWLSCWSISWVWDRDSYALRRLFENYCTHIAVGAFQFDFCDVLADFADRAVRKTDDPNVLRAAVGALIELGHNHNRWYVRGVLTGLLQAVRTGEMAVAAAEGLGTADSSAVRWAIQDFTARSLHPALRDAIGRHLGEP